MGLHGLSLSIRQIMQEVLALTGAAGWSVKTAFRDSNLIVFDIVLLSLWVPRVLMIWSHAQEIYYTGTGQVLRGHHKNQGTSQYNLIYIYTSFV